LRTPELVLNGTLKSVWRSGQRFALVLLVLILFMDTTPAQVSGDFLNLKRGMLWETINIAKIGPVFQNWARKGYGMDFPGFDPEFIPREIGGGNSHHLGGGFWIGAERPASSDSIWGVIDWGLFATSVGESPVNSPYLLKKHTFRWPNGENYWLQTDPHEAEEVIDTEFEFNPRYRYPFKPPRFLPVRVKRTVRAWSGSKLDEKYIIIEYVITNISREAHIYDAQIADPENFRVLQADSVLQNVMLMFTYSFGINTRAWSILFPEYGHGAQGNRFLYDPRRRLIYGWADDFAKKAGNEKFGPYEYFSGGPPGGKEWLAPAYAGIQFLHISPNKQNQTNWVNQVGWSVSEPPNSYPLIGFETPRERFEAIRDINLAYQPIVFPQGLGDPRWNQSRLWTMATVGPWDLYPGDSLRIVMAEVVGCIDYWRAFDKATTEQEIASAGLADINRNADRAQFNFDNQYNVPDPPAAPQRFELEHMTGSRIGNIIRWSDNPESIPDTDYSGAEAYDLAGYRLYRSQFLPFGPYLLIADIPKQDARFYDAGSRMYTFLDTVVNVGYGYYYAISSYDTGHDHWPPNPAARFAETNSNAVPSLESSFYPNHWTGEPFIAAYSPENIELDGILVVPNPFVRVSGISTEGAQDRISFVHIPSPCTIKIYTLRGDLVKTIEHRENIGIAQWDQITDYGQFAESGVYIYHVRSLAPESFGKVHTGKFAIVR
jgi:hypothetical protein